MESVSLPGSKDRQARNQPVAEAMEPTSVKGTRMASPRSKPTSVAIVRATTADEGVWNFS